MLKKLLLLLVMAAILPHFAVKAQNTSNNENREADRAAILADIEAVTQAFITLDIEKIHSTHSEDWRGFIESSDSPIKGINEYMRANQLPYPPPPNMPKAPASLTANITFRISNFDLYFISQDIGLANFILEFIRKTDDKITVLTKYRISDIYSKRNGKWIQTASHTSLDSNWVNKANTEAFIPPQPLQQQILKAREAFWGAWFTNDRSKLEEMLAEKIIALEENSSDWKNRETILKGAKEFAESGGNLTKLEFPSTEIQVYGSTWILYTTYLFELEQNGKKIINTGKGVETYVKRGDKFINIGWVLTVDK
ncbi:MAG: nuclear transport factor 2 family protein [Pyrinomonadaceae bacterium]|nr:nuclear transport factor 2 family protein [Pyrinomonadaceae bacterium]